MMSIKDRLTFAWWNTGLSPAGKERSGTGAVSDDDVRIAVGIVNGLFQTLDVDCLALGEVTRTDLYRLCDCLKRRECSVYDGTHRDGRLVFDTGVIYRTDRISLDFDLAIMDLWGDRKLKLANWLILMVQDEARPFHLFVSHWPSHVQPDSEQLRITMACRLRAKVDEIIEHSMDDAYIILMGDFNEEPFHHCMEHELLATRDRSLARKRARHLYNPFWRHLGESAPHTCHDTSSSFAGTCFIKRGNATKWKTVDQIIVSSAFWGSSDWHLNEKLTMFLPVTPMALLGPSPAGIFDHFPVIAVFDRVYSDGGGPND
jgi:hypothetical protein